MIPRLGRGGALALVRRLNPLCCFMEISCAGLLLTTLRNGGRSRALAPRSLSKPGRGWILATGPTTRHAWHSPPSFSLEFSHVRRIPPGLWRSSIQSMTECVPSDVASGCLSICMSAGGMWRVGRRGYIFGGAGKSRRAGKDSTVFGYAFDGVAYGFCVRGI
jgi:hypothetical protein